MEIMSSTRFSMRQFLSSFVRRKKLIAVTLVFGSLGIVPVVLGGYEAIQVVDSAAFCTKTCHDVHYPEAVAYEGSPHSEVTCAQCHVGEGTANLVVSKLKGLKEILPTLTGNYHKPIATPLQDRRPTSQTCEACHWSSKYSGDKPLIETSYAADANNTKSQFTLVLKVNGGLPEVSSGIHWHTTAKVWYLPADDQRQEIIWVATEDASGNVTEYVDPNRVGDITPELIKAKKRQMDCIDCHNRVTHLFQSPDELIDAALTGGSIDINLPFIKRQGLAALVPQNKTLTEAYAKVEAISDFYKNSYPNLSENQTQGLIKSIAKLKEIAKLTTFSDGLDWNTHPDNAVHDKPDAEWQIDWATVAAEDKSSGCFRCHGNLLKVDNQGQQLSIAQSLNGENIARFVERVNLTVANLAEDNRAASVTPNGSNKTVSLVINGDNQTVRMPTGAYGRDGLKADCNTCHYTRQDGAGDTPIAPAVPHPTDRLDNCLVCHSPGSAYPFKQTHPWATNDACRSCHQAAPKLKSLPSALPSEAPVIPHSTVRLESCLSCHGPAAVKPIVPGHPWATEATCTVCHKSATALKPIPLSIPIVAKEIAHVTVGFENCLSCHGQPTVIPFKTTHPWSNEACTTCHKPAAILKPVPLPRPIESKPISHVTTGLDNCLSCHGQLTVMPFKTTHPWTTNEACSICHKPSTNPQPLPLPKPIVAKPIAHVTTGFENCLSCHGQPLVIPFKTAHPWTTNETCAICHKTVSAPAPGTPAALPPASTVSHSISGLPGCSACHNTAGIGPFPVSHIGRTDGFCLICHRATGGVQQITQSLPVGPGIPHSTTGLPGCTTCHQSGGPAPFAANHAGRPDSFCSLCHTPTGSLTAPGSPGGLSSVVINAGQINLSWVDNVSGETGFRIERATNNSFTTGLVTITSTTANAISYSDATVSGNTTYYYRVYAFNVVGNSAASNTASATTPVSVVLPPTAASSLSASAASATQINITWLDNAATETGYRIDRATNSGFTANLTAINAAANAVSYSDTTVSGNTTYYYRVYAFNSGGNSAASNTASATTPAPVIDPVAMYASNCASCHGANREGGSSGQPAMTNAALAGRTLAQVTASLTTGSMASYTSTFNSAQIAALAQWLKGSPPVAASGLSASAISAGQINLGWADNSADETGFRIERATNNAFTANLISINATANAISYSDATVSGNTTYYYRVYAFNVVGNSAASNTASATTPVSVVLPPTAASSLSASAASATQINITWLDNAATETGYRIDRATNSGFTANLTAINAAANAVSYSDTTVSGNTTYYYRVYAFNSGGNSAASNTASATTPVPVIDPAALYASDCASCHGANREGGSSGQPAMTNAALAGRTLAQVTATLTTGSMASYTSTYSTAERSALAQWLKGSPPVAASGLSASAISAGQINLGWADNSADETGFRIERATNNTFTAGLVTVTTTAANAVSYSDVTVSGNMTYYYRVYALNISGDSTASNTATATTPVSLVLPPAAASGLTATAVSAIQVNLSWVDNGINENGFRIVRATNSAFTTGLVTVTSTAANITTYSDTTVSGSTVYWYRVYAFNPGGDSAASNTASATTPAPTSAQIYTTNCASCHGNAGQGASAPLIAGTAAPTNRFLTRGGGITMPAFNSMQINDTTLTGLSSYVTTLGPVPTTASQIYALNCAVCHGATGLGTALAPHLAGVNATITTTSTRSGLGNSLGLIMPAYVAADISNTNLTILANYIATMGPPPTDGWGVYAEYCAMCHASDGRGGSSGVNVVGKSVSGIVRNGSGSMPGYSTSQISNAALTNLQSYMNSLNIARPTGLTATAANSSQVNLTWASSALNDSGTRLQRATNSSFSSNLVTFNLGLVTSYSDTAVAAGTTYYYRVYATNSQSGNSQASTTATVTTP